MMEFTFSMNLLEQNISIDFIIHLHANRKLFRNFNSYNSFDNKQHIYYFPFKRDFGTANPGGYDLIIMSSQYQWLFQQLFIIKLLYSIAFFTYQFFKFNCMQWHVLSPRQSVKCISMATYRFHEVVISSVVGWVRGLRPLLHGNNIDPLTNMRHNQYCLAYGQWLARRPFLVEQIRICFRIVCVCNFLL